MVQIYQNPEAIYASQVANQHNPEFAALNSIAAGWADGPITAATAQMELDDKFGGLKGALKQKQLDRKWAKGDRDIDWLNRLKFIQASRGYDPSNMIDLPTAFKSFARGSENGTNPLPNIEEMLQNDASGVPNVLQANVNAVPNFAQFNKNDPYSVAISGIDTEPYEQAVATERVNYVTDPNNTTREALNASVAQLNAARQEQNAKSKRIRDQKSISDGSKPFDNAFINWLKSFGNSDYSRRVYNQTLQAAPWARRVGEYNGVTNDMQAAQQLADQQKFIQETMKDLDQRGLRQVDTSIVNNLMAQTPFNFNPDTDIVVTNGAGNLFLYNVTDGKLTQIR